MAAFTVPPITAPISNSGGASITITPQWYDYLKNLYTRSGEFTGLTDQIKFTSKTAIGWTTTNDILAKGRPGYEQDTGKFKIGDGATAWNSLAYACYTPAQTDALLALKLSVGTTTSSIAEGVNQYFTNARAISAVNLAANFAVFSATPIPQPTTAITAGAFVANTSGIANDSATFDGYTIGQIAAALRALGILA